MNARKMLIAAHKGGKDCWVRAESHNVDGISQNLQSLSPY